MTQKKILFVAMAHSVHAAHWLNLLAESADYEILLYSSLYVPTHASLNAKVKVFYPPLLGTKFSETGKNHKLRRVIDLVRCRLLGMPRGSDHQMVKPLVRLIQEHKPDVVHGLEFQHSCYLAAAAIKQIPKEDRPIFGVTNWGSDIFHYQKYPKHLARIKELLAEADFYSCECARDIEIVRSMGFTGKLWPVIPGCGGLEMNIIEKILQSAAIPSQRTQIMIKGYQHFAGRALTTLAALKKCIEEIRPYTLVIFSASKKVRGAYEKFARENNVKIEFIKGISREEMLTHYSKSRCFISTGVSDGISTSVLEAMSVGCFPIQSDSSCCTEWFENGRTGFATSIEKITSIVSAIKLTLSYDELVDKAAPVNQQTIEARCDDRQVQKILLSHYGVLCNK